MASGTIVRGAPDPASDLDLYVLHRGSFRQRLQKFFNGVPAEIFVNPPSAVERYFAEEQAEGRPLTAHMLATGAVILELDPVVSALRRKTIQLLAQPPDPTPERLTMARYMAATRHEDALDVVTRDPALARMLLSQAVDDILRFCFLQARMFLPRSKELLRAFTEIDPQTAAMVRRFFAAPDLEAQLELAGQIADRTIGVRGFFEWESAPEILA